MGELRGRFNDCEQLAKTQQSEYIRKSYYFDNDLELMNEISEKALSFDHEAVASWIDSFNVEFY